MLTEPLLVVLPVNAKDVELAIKMLRWVQDLSEKNTVPYPILLVVDRSVESGMSDTLKRIAVEVFGHVTRIETQTVEEYPGAATEMFGTAARQIKGAFRLPWLWLEPDCVPLSKSWLDVLSEAYYSQPKRYFGPFIRSQSAQFPSVHLNGVSIYPQDALDDFKPFLAGEIESQWKAWDLMAHKVVIPRASETALIQQFFGHPGLPPIFIDRPKSETDPENATTFALVDSRAVLFHRCKDGSLIDVLRARKDGPKKKVSPPPIATMSPKQREASLEIG